MGRSRYQVLGTQPHFLTCTIVNWIPLFSQVEIAQIILDSLQFLHQRQRLTLHAYVIMENHLHLIASAANLSKEICNFKSFTARTIVDLLKKDNNNYILNQLEFYKLKHKHDQEYQLWQEGFHPKAILNEVMFRQKLDYIHNNPIERGYVDEPSHWRYSSYRNYMGRMGLLEVEMLGEAEPLGRHSQATAQERGMRADSGNEGMGAKLENNGRQSLSEGIPRRSLGTRG